MASNEDKKEEAVMNLVWKRGCWFFGVLMVVLFSSGCGAEEGNRISKEELKGMLGRPDLRIIDVRQPGDWNSATEKIKGAIREEPDQVPKWMGKYAKDNNFVFHCS